MSIQSSINNILGSVSRATAAVQKSLETTALEKLQAELTKTKSESAATEAQLRKELAYTQKRANVKARAASAAVKSAKKEGAEALSAAQKEYENKIAQQAKGTSTIDAKLRKELLRSQKGNFHAQRAIVLAFNRRQQRIAAFERAQKGAEANGGK